MYSLFRFINFNFNGLKNFIMHSIYILVFQYKTQEQKKQIKYNKIILII